MLKLVEILFLVIVGVSAAPTSPQWTDEEAQSVHDFTQYYLALVPPLELLTNRSVAVGIDQCLPSQLIYCQTQFATDLGQTVEIFNDPIKFADLIGEYYKKENVVESLIKLCNAQTKFRVCLNVLYQKCTDALMVFQDQIPDLTKAFVLAGVYDDLEFDCGGGLLQGLTHWPCIAKVNNNAGYISATQLCITAYYATVNDSKQYCQAANDLSKCFTDVYTSLEDCVDNDIAWWVCERVNRRGKLDGYCPQNTCAGIFKPKSSASSIGTPTELIVSGRMISDARHKFFKLIGLPRGQRHLH